MIIFCYNAKFLKIPQKGFALNEAFLQGTKKPYCESIRADGFRVIWHIYAGRARFVNRPESVYSYNTAMGGGDLGFFKES